MEAIQLTKVCPKCQETKPLSAFTLRLSGKRKGQAIAHCKECRVDIEHVRKKRDPTIYRRTEWPSKLKRLYGITVDEYHRILAEQGGGCGICGAQTPGGRKYVREGLPMFQVDHCHATGRVRGLLCNFCNRALGLIRDNPDVAQRMVKYLTREG